MEELVAAIEAGGTKWVCAIGSAKGEVIDEIVIDTAEPVETVHAACAALLRLSEKHGRIHRLGVGIFGPIRLASTAADYGTFLNTPKLAWQGFNLIAELQRQLGKDLPIHLETDVNTAALAEYHAAGKMSSLVYVTIGTGIGGGAVIDGRLLRGRMHPEVGHLPVPESPLEPHAGFSACPFHRDCIEGKASGPAMTERWGTPPTNLPVDHPAWELEADYLASLAVTLTATYSPDVIVLGGGVMEHRRLIDQVRRHFTQKCGGYWELPELDRYLIRTTLDNRAGLIGALMLND